MTDLLQRKIVAIARGPGLESGDVYRVVEFEDGGSAGQWYRPGAGWEFEDDAAYWMWEATVFTADDLRELEYSEDDIRTIMTDEYPRTAHHDFPYDTEADDR